MAVIWSVDLISFYFRLSEDARELEAMNTSLRLKVAELRERLEDKANQQQERKITPDREEEILTDSINPIRSFKRELSFNKVEKRNLWYSSKGRFLAVGDEERASKQTNKKQQQNKRKQIIAYC